MSRPLPLAVFVSGQGTTLDALAEGMQGGHLPARIAIVLADRPHAVAIERARHRGLATEVLPFRGMPESEWVDRADRILHARGVELIVLAGFLAILPARFVELWEGRIINLHPSLLPRFAGRGYYGTRVLEAIIESGEPETGVTVHMVTPAVDEGPVLEQRSFFVSPGESVETLRERIRPYELAALESVIRQFADGTLPLPYHPPARTTPTGARRRPGTGSG
jgi:phosphoribosylglycinamide formyltransferase-1